ncbi:MAG: hypothetical protein IJJ25_04405 [Lachnospiraceae bacterium]|nr:hypothetical protein [Lachnospiraceae bacterium]
MKSTRSFIPKLIGLFMILAAAAFLTVSIPKTTYAAKTYTTLYESQNIKKVNVKGKKVKIYGSNRSLSTYELQPCGWHTFKVTSKTKYRKLVNSETGKTKKMTKKAALKKLKKRNFIAVYIYYKKGGKITKILFGV